MARGGNVEGTQFVATEPVRHRESRSGSVDERQRIGQLDKAVDTHEHLTALPDQGVLSDALDHDGSVERLVPDLMWRSLPDVPRTGHFGRAATESRLLSRMAKLFLTHTVADYDTWRTVFDQDAARRDGYGLTGVTVLRDTSDANRIWMVADGDPGKADEMMHDPELAAAMERAGVTGPPELFVAG